MSSSGLISKSIELDVTKENPLAHYFSCSV